MASLDLEDESVLSAIFQGSFPDTWRDNSDFAQYLAELSSFGVDKLSREPERLAEERATILEETQDLAFHNYKTFIQTAECSKEIFQDFQIIEKSVASMLEGLPELSEQCQGFMTQAQNIHASRRMNSLTLQKHTQLLEILEVPQLMDTCVRNGYYEEALELGAYVRRLEKKHSAIPVVQSIVSEVKVCSQLMLSQLIQQLRTNVQLPACLRVIGYLRRMDVFTELELRIKFLQARDSWFQGILKGIPRDDAYFHITKTIEASRVHLFDVITQYRAIFSDEDPIFTPNKEDSMNEASLFHGWVVQKVSQFLQTLKDDLSRGIGARLDSLLGQCMYFGLSFSRVGADFRGLLAPIFQNACLQGFRNATVAANGRFDDLMQSYNLVTTSGLLPSSSYSLPSQTGQLQPPNVFLEFPPLAQYCNDMLTAFNELRLCAPIALTYDVTALLHDSLDVIVKGILAFHKAEESMLDDHEHDQLSRLCSVFVQDLVPYFNKCLQVLFPPSQISQTLGVPVLQLVKMNNIGFLDVTTLTKPLEHLMPKKEEVEETKPVIGPEIGQTSDDSALNQSENVLQDSSETEKSDNHDEQIDEGGEITKDSKQVNESEDKQKEVDSLKETDINNETDALKETKEDENETSKENLQDKHESNDSKSTNIENDNIATEESATEQVQFSENQAKKSD
ncbi:unnamed protein product [Owenia fusiformis]|uniref:Conserved oligomeric Golgi complex subunit 8 n=1 Tax=Owenia fusiformis TaxID=6347 RepID=A0A8J1XXU4_OWEFU|nr:unnamed protein product [Owenia fusiformis]